MSEPRKSPRRHAADVCFHLGNALRSVEALARQARDPETYERAQAQRARLAEAHQDAIDLRDAIPAARESVR